MNWDIISSVTDIIGTITIVITLLYVLMQIRLNSRQLGRSIQANRTSNMQSVIENANLWREMVLGDDNADIWIRGLNDLHSLNQIEKMKFNMMAGSLIWTCWFVYQLQRNEGLMPDVNSSMFQDLYKHTGYRDWLLAHEKLHTDDFRDFLEEVKTSVGDIRYQFGESSSLTDGIY
jgi:hypothetical protein